jgi:acyl dehydratase
MRMVEMGKSVVISVGEEIPSLTKTAFMPIDPNARNPIHTDDYAREHGMRGALIGGSTVLSYVLEMLYDYFGQNWLYHGKINVSFIGGGAVNGDVVTSQGRVVSAEPEKGRIKLKLNVWVENQTGAKIVVGEATCVK